VGRGDARHSKENHCVGQISTNQVNGSSIGSANNKGDGGILSETPIPFEDGVLTNGLGGLVDAGPVNTKVGHNTLCLALDQLKRTDSGQLLRGEE